MNGTIARQLLFPRVLRLAKILQPSCESVHDACLLVLGLNQAPDGISEDSFRDAQKAARDIVENFM